MIEMLDPVGRRIIDLRQDFQGLHFDIQKVETKFTEFEDEFMPS